ncbi:hypothetical protein TCDM_03907 [Trypanosoma cruzi Dm28c]|uniref:Uncharacterized protein n=1 Tax=Trypanosoma cruzi Dm28c TaxID=1416333 RepID=V5BMQ6_TRYCR|nr:hypothetical protein TCDM_03907 [Trypanosoma cruzi Dm28c]PBJ72113.1 hypothetical protein BCY84_16027 [Trypanosoma cruzi cruzi]
MPTLEVATLLGQHLGDKLRVTSAMVVMDRIVVVGTDAGCVLAFSQPSSGAEVGTVGVCVYARTLHHGPVHCMCASASHLVASAGHDAAPVVQPVLNLLTNGVAQTDRLSGHTLPLTAMTFFSSGNWLATCGLGGRLIVFDTTTRSSLCDVSVGFSVRSLALSPDETTCFLGGTRIVRVDLYQNTRPVEPMIRREHPLWLQHYSWSSNGDEFVAEAPDDLFIARLTVTEDRLTAVFRPRGGSGADYAIATWRLGAVDFWLSRDFCRPADKMQVGDGEERLQCSSFRDIFFEESKEDAAPVLQANDGWDTWRRARVRLECGPPLLTLKRDEGLADCLFSALNDTPAGRLAYEEERGRILQVECDEVVRLLKAAMRRDGRKRGRSSAAA